MYSCFAAGVQPSAGVSCMCVPGGLGVQGFTSPGVSNPRACVLGAS